MPLPAHIVARCFLRIFQKNTSGFEIPCCGPGGASRALHMNSHASIPLTILDRDAKRLIKRQKLSHPRFGAPHRALPAGPQPGLASQRVSKAGRRQLDESLPLRSHGGDDNPRTTFASGKGRGNVGHPRLKSMVGTVGMGSDVKLIEVRAKYSSPFCPVPKVSSD